MMTKAPFNKVFKGSYFKSIWIFAIAIYVNIPLTALHAQDLDGFSNKFICNLATDELGKKRVWTSDNSLKKYVKEAWRRSLNCLSSNSQNTRPNPIDMLRNEFAKLHSYQRKKVQTNLKRLDLYRSSIDGLYGKGTADALSSYNNQNLNNADLKKAANVLKLLDAVLAHKFDPDPDATATIKPTEPPKTEPKPLPTIKPKSPPDETRKVASGTGFYVSAKGHIVTNHHVIDGCQEIKVHSKGKVFDVVKLASDVQNDLALLQIEISPSHVFALSQDSPYPLQNIIVAGFPFGHRYSSSLKFTQGIVSSLTGVGNNYSEIQIDAALQPGNSGGPIMDEAGNIVGVAVAKLALKQIVEDYGVIPENTNFGVKASAVRNLMEGNQVPTKSPSTVKPSRADLSRMATAGTVYLTCWMTTAQINQMRKKKVLFSELE